jgi:Rrf2 family protein
MNVTLSKRGSYAARAAVCLARAYDTDRPKKLREISAEMDIPRTFVSQILGDLVHAGIAVATFGRDGGHRLARPPDRVTVAEVIEAAEGPLDPQRCAMGDGPCRWTSVCPLHETMTLATASLRDVLTGTTLAMLAERDLAIEAGTYPVPGDAHPHLPMVSIVDTVQVELPTAAVAARLRGGGSWLTRHAEASDDDEDSRIRVDLAGPGGHGKHGKHSWLGRTVAVHLGEPAETDDSLSLPFIWEASGPAGIFPRFEGRLRLSSLDPNRSELSLAGNYRPPLGRAGQVLDEALLGRVAQAGLRSFLRRIARVLEEEQAASPRM